MSLVATVSQKNGDDREIDGTEGALQTKQNLTKKTSNEDGGQLHLFKRDCRKSTQ